MAIEVTLAQDTIWLTQNELNPNLTVSKMEIVRKEGKRLVKRTVEHYNLDLIISVGYRVNSLRGTQFRIWANKILKDYLVKGYAINEKRVQEQKEQLEQLKQTVKLLGNVLDTQPLSSDEATGLLKIITDYTYALDILDQYEHQLLAIASTTSQELFPITYEAAMNAIYGLRDKFGGSSLFGNEKDESFQGSLAAIIKPSEESTSIQA